MVIFLVRYLLRCKNGTSPAMNTIRKKKRYINMLIIIAFLVSYIIGWQIISKEDWKAFGGYKLEGLLQSLPRTLRTDVMKFLYGSLVEKVPFFKHIDGKTGVIETVVSRLHNELYLKGEYVCKEGDVGEEMFFLRSGELHVSVKKELVDIFHEGHHFGEIAILSDKVGRRTATIQADCLSQVASLSKNDFKYITSLFPQINDQVKKIARARIERAKKVGVRYNHIGSIGSPSSTSRTMAKKEKQYQRFGSKKNDEL